MKKLTHLDDAGNPKMVDVSAKADTLREAVAKGQVTMQPETFYLLQEGKTAKGDAFAAARLAGIMAAKKTPELIPLCHPLLLTDVAVDIVPDEAKHAVEITARATSTGKTGVEMEALTAVAVAALTVYDMGKAVDRTMKLENIRLVSKRGGKSGALQLE